MTAPGTQHHPATSSGILAFIVEDQRLRACLVDLVGGDHRLVSWVNVERSPHAPLSGQLATVIRRMGLRLGRQLWNRALQAPLTASTDPIRVPPLQFVTGAIGISKPLRVWLAGLTEQVSIAALEQALVTVPVDIVGRTRLAPTVDPARLATELGARHPQLLIVAGGYDNREAAAQTDSQMLSMLIGDVLKRLPAARLPLVVYAGNRWAAEAAEGIIQEANAALRVVSVDNVQPRPAQLDPGALVRLLHDEHWRQVRNEPGIANLDRWLTEPARLLPVDTSFVRLAQLWRVAHELRDLHAIHQQEQGRLHVWTSQSQRGVRLLYAPNGSGTGPDGWPPPALLSGPEPDGAQPPASLRWWDHSGMAPLVATVGQVDVAAMLQALELDLLRPLR